MRHLKLENGIVNLNILCVRIPKLLIPVCLYAPTPNWTAKFEGEIEKNDEGSEEEMNMTDERGRR